MTRLVVAGLFAVLALSTLAAAQTESGVVASFAGQLSTPAQEDRIAFEVTTDHFALTTNGRISLVFVLSADDSSSLDPGLIKLVAKGTGDVEVGGTRRPDTAGSQASIALATLAVGTYDILVRGEHKTTGAYRLDVLLAGDANGDLKVDATDLVVIDQLTPVRVGEAEYSAFADVARTILIKAQGIDNQAGSAGVIGTQGTVQVKMAGFGALHAPQSRGARR